MWERMFHWGFRSAEMQHRASLDANIFYLDTIAQGPSITSVTALDIIAIMGSTLDSRCVGREIK